MLTAVKPAVAAIPLSVLLVGAREEDFFLVREILERNRHTLAADLDHAHTLEEAKAMLQQKAYSLLLFQHDTDNSEAVQLLSQIQHTRVTIPFILLTEHADERTVAKIIEAGAWNCVPRSQLDGATLVRTIHSTLALHSLQQEQQIAEESLRKLSRAVEQSPDAVMIPARDH